MTDQNTEVIETDQQPDNEVTTNEAAQQDASHPTDAGDVWEGEFDPDTPPELMDGHDSVKGDPAESMDEETPDADVESDLEAQYRAQLGSDEKLPKPILVKYKGKYIDVQTVDELRDLAERGVMATQKAAELAEIKRSLEGISQEDIDLLRRARQGDREALEALVSSPSSPQPDPALSEAETVAREILESPYAEKIKATMQMVPPQQREVFAQNPQMLRALQRDFEDGTAEKLMPTVERLVAVRGMDFLSAYRQAAIEVLGSQESRQQQAKSLSANPGARASVTDHQPEPDIWEMSSEDFRRLMDKARR